MLDAAPRVRVLATSQRPLGLAGEVVQPLAPLPDDDAVALFAQRAGERRASFTLSAELGPTVARLCRALDCLPLAIELAAARARILTVPEIAQRLDDRFTLLADPTSSRPERSRSLAAALSWSYDLLFPDDQRGLWALAQFPDGATMPAVEHVLIALGVPGGSALDVVDRLVDRSLVTVDTGGPAATRYRLLDSVRAFAADRAVEARIADTAADAVLGWVAGLAEAVATQVRGSEQARLVAATAAERATIDAALDRARTRDPATGLRVAVGFGSAWVLLDDGAAAAKMCTARIAAEQAGAAPRDLRVTALLLESWLEAMPGDLRPARTALDAAIALAGDDDELGDLVRWYGGFVLFQESRAAESLADLQRCRVAYAARGAGWEEGASLLLGAFAHIALGDTAAGRADCEQAIRIITPLGDSWGLLHAENALGRIARAAMHLTHLGQAQHELADPAAADTLSRAIAGAELAGDLRLVAMSRVALAEVLKAAGERPSAHDLLVEANRWYTESGAGDGATLVACVLATMRAEDGDPDALHELQAIRAAARDAGDQHVLTLASDALGGVGAAI